MRWLFTLLCACFWLQGFTAKKPYRLIADIDSNKHHIKKEIIFPEPGNVNKLFYIQRDPNTNTLIYELNADKAGGLNEKEPIHIYWIKYAEKGQKEELNYIQRKFAYGISARLVKADEYDIRFTAYKKLPLTLTKGTDGKYHIFTPIAKKQVILNRIFVKIEGGSFWIPNIIYVELKGTDPATGKEIIEHFKP